MAPPQHQEGERAEYGGDQQGQEDVFPAAVWDRQNENKPLQLKCTRFIHNVRQGHIQNSQSLMLRTALHISIIMTVLTRKLTLPDISVLPFQSK